MGYYLDAWEKYKSKADATTNEGSKEKGVGDQKTFGEFGYGSGYGYGHSGGHASSFNCSHKDGRVWMTMDEGKTQIGSGRVSYHGKGEFDLTIDCSNTMKKTSIFTYSGFTDKQISRLARHGPAAPKNFIAIQWTDYNEPDLDFEFWWDLYDLIKEKKVYICCMGGHGRTGTACAALIISHLGMSAVDAIAFVRKHYCDEAVESVRQEKYLCQLYTYYLEKTKPELTPDELSEIEKQQFKDIAPKKKSSSKGTVFSGASGDKKGDANATTLFTQAAAKDQKEGGKEETKTGAGSDGGGKAGDLATSALSYNSAERDAFHRGLCPFCFKDGQDNIAMSKVSEDSKVEQIPLTTETCWCKSCDTCVKYTIMDNQIIYRELSEFEDSSNFGWMI